MSAALRRFLHTHSAISVTIFTIVFWLAGTEMVAAGFGITPPYVNNQRLTRGSVFEQRITLVRSDPTDDLLAQVTMNIPEAQNWFSIDRGEEFLLPAGSTQIPIIVTVRIPEDAEYDTYGGAIRLRTSPVEAPESGSVSIALGAQIDVDIEVVDKIFDFDVRKVRMADLEEGRRRFGLFFPAKIQFFMTIENTGNTDFGPTRVQFDIFDSEKETLLETVENTNEIQNIAPFAIEEVVAELPTRLPAGRYTAKYTIYKGENEVAQQGEVNVSIATIGALFDYEGYGFFGLSVADKAKVAAVLGVPVILLVVVAWVVAVKRRQRKNRHAQYSQTF